VSAQTKISSVLQIWFVHVVTRPRAATSEKFWRGQKSLLAMIMTSSMCSQPWCDLFAMISLLIKRKEMMINSEKRKLFHDHYQSHILFHQTFF